MSVGATRLLACVSTAVALVAAAVVVPGVVDGAWAGVVRVVLTMSGFAVFVAVGAQVTERLLRGPR